MRRLYPVARLATFLLAATLLAGCQTLGSAGLIQSAATAQLTPETASSIADDMVGRFAEQVGPGSTTIQLRSDGSVFAEALEVSLRSRGYAVLTDQANDGTGVVALAYVVDDFEGAILVRLSTLAVDLTRIYSLGASGATPVSPLSVMQRGAGTQS